MLRTRLFEVADERGTRYTWLAEKLGYTPEYLSRIKHGVAPITEEFQRRACALFPELAPEYLFFAADDDYIHRLISSRIVRQGESKVAS